MQFIKTSCFPTPAGDMILGSYGTKICLADWITYRGVRPVILRLCRMLGANVVEEESDVISDAKTQLAEYFAGKRKNFTIPLLCLGTDFQCRVWAELRRIPYGETISYAQQAARLGNPKAVRAVASANAMNAISIFIPCHRVISRNYAIGGYRGGVAAKQYLLDLERNVVQLTTSFIP